MSSVIQAPPDQEPVEPEGNGQLVVAAKGTSGRKSFSKLRRELSDDEAASPAVQRMLLDEIERLDNQLIEECQFREKFHAVDKLHAGLQERFKTKISIEIVHVTCFAVGGAAIGYATSNWAVQPIGMIALVFGGIIIMAGIIAKAVKP